MNRRTMIVAGGAFVVAGATVAGLAWPGSVFQRIIFRHLPGIRLADAEIQDFTEKYWPILQQRYGTQTIRRLLTHLADEVIPGTMTATARLERELVTEFLIGSNFFELHDPTMQSVEFNDIVVACVNPFRRT